MCSQPKSPVKNISKGIEGRWKVIGCQLNGVWLPPPIFVNFLYTFPDNRHFHLAWGELSFSQYVGSFPKSETGTIALNASSEPHTIDLIPDKGEFAGKTFKGIFHLDYDILKACFAFPGHERPQAFNAEQGQVYEVWQRLS